MKLTVLLCLAALAFDGLEAANTGRQKSGACMKTTYVGKLHETNAKGHEECVGTFSGSSSFEQPAECCWSSFAEKCKEFLGGLVNILSSATTCNPCGKGCTSIDLDMKSRITKPASHPQCETQPAVHVQPVYKQVVYTAPQEHCSGDCEQSHHHVKPVIVQQPVYKQVVYQPKEECGDECEQPQQQVVQTVQQPVQQPVFQTVQQPVQQPVYQPVIEQVHVVPVKEGCDDCEEKKHKHHRHHKHHKHHHKHHKKDKCETDECE